MGLWGYPQLCAALKVLELSSPDSKFKANGRWIKKIVKQIWSNNFKLLKNYSVALNLNSALILKTILLILTLIKNVNCEVWSESLWTKWTWPKFGRGPTWPINWINKVLKFGLNPSFDPYEARLSTLDPEDNSTRKLGQPSWVWPHYYQAHSRVILNQNHALNFIAKIVLTILLNPTDVKKFYVSSATKPS